MKKAATNFLVEVNGVLLADATVNLADQLEVNLVSAAGQEKAVLAVTAFLPDATKVKYVHSKNVTVAAGDLVTIRLEAVDGEKSTSITNSNSVGNEAESRGGMFCSFCGKPNTEVSQMVAGAKAVICNECTDLCHEIVHQT